jgi:hypothetical protein
MIALWMLYSTFIGGLLLVCAGALDEVQRIGWRPARWVWLGALASTMVLSGVGWATRQSVPAEAAAMVVPVTSSAMVINGERADRFAHDGRAGSEAASRPAVRAVNVPMGGLLTKVGAAIGSDRLRGMDGPMIALWLMASGILTLMIARTIQRSRNQRAGWPVRELPGGAVRVAPGTGPVVIGIVRPEVVVPEWLVERGGEQLRLALEHEREHVRAGDPLVLLAAALLVAAAPWNLPAWWMLSRLRLAVEMDCDRRVIRRGVAHGAYGSLLLNIASERRTGGPAGALALIGTRSHLETRILGLISPRVSHPIRRTVALCAIASTASFAACQSRFTGPAEVALAPDAARADEVGRAANPDPAEPAAESPRVASDGTAPPRIDSIRIADRGVFGLVPATDSASAGPPRMIELRATRAVPSAAASSGQPTRRSIEGSGPIVIFRASAVADTPAVPVRVPIDVARITRGDTIPPDRASFSPSSVESRRPPIIVDGVRLSVEPTIFVDGMRVLGVPAQRRPLIVLDGEIVDQGVDRILESREVESIEVIKGPAAVHLFGPRGAHGVVEIRTRDGAPAPRVPQRPEPPSAPPARTPPEIGPSPDSAPAPAPLRPTTPLPPPAPAPDRP